MQSISEARHSMLMYRFIYLACMIIVMACVLPAAAYADEKAEVVRVGYYENEVFEEGAHEGKVKTGYAYEYYRKLSEYTGWKYEYVYGDFSELYQKLLDGKIDLLAGLAWRKDRSKLIGYPDAEMGSESYYLVKHDKDTKITADPSSLNGCKIGVLDSAMVGILNKYLDDNHVTAEVVTFSDYTQLFDAFDSDEVSVLAAESDGAHGREHSEVLTVFGTADYYLCVNKDRKDLLSELNTAQTMLATEEPNYLNMLRTKYYSVSVTATVFSKAERDWMNDHTALHVGYLDNYLPYSDKDEQGEVTGIVKDIVPAIMGKMGMQDISVSYSGFTNYDDMVAAVSSGDVDVAFPVGGGLYYSEESGIYQSNAVSSSPVELIYKGEFDEKMTEHIAVNKNNSMQYYFVQANYPDAEISYYQSVEECLAAVLDGEVGCMSLNGLRAHDILRNRKYEGLSLYQTSYNDARCFGVKIGNEGLLKLLNRGINVLGDEYALGVANRYTSGLYSYSIMDALQDHMALVGSIFFIIAAIIVFLLLRDVYRKKREVEEKEKARLELEAKNKELEESEKALSEALDAAEQASRAKTVFLNNMSHDIRTPMNAIVGFTGLAESHLDDKEQLKDYLGKISVSSQHLLSLINDVLDMSRIESGKVTIEESEVHLPDVIHDLRTIIQSNINSKQQELSVDTQGIIHEDIITDKLRLNQVLLNILSNAMKYTPEGGKISFRVTEKPSDSDDMADYEFRIKDNGIGMSEEFQKTLFESFTREKNTTVSGIQGTGLGMAIAKSLIDMMGGEITVHSAEGKGSEFIIDLPCKICSVSKKAKDDSRSSSKPDFSGKRVLLAEDNEMNQILAQQILTDVGLAVDIACDGLEAVEKMDSAPAGYYDIILMDIQMPNMDGYEAAAKIRAMDDKQKAGIPIVAVTANAFQEDRQIALDAGMNGHLAKPYDIPKIMETLSELLSMDL